MNRIKYITVTTAVVAGLSIGAAALMLFAPAEAIAETLGPMAAADYNAEAAKFDQEAIALEAKAEQHARMAALYRGLISGGSKQESTYRSIANHHDRLAESYRKAAAEARAKAEASRQKGTTK